MELEQLVVPLLMDNSDFLKKIEESKKGSDGLVGSLKTIGTGVVAGGIAIAGVGIAALGGFLYGATQNAIENEQIQAKLAQTIKNMGFKGTANEVNNYANELSKLTGVDDDEISATEEVLIKRGIQADQLRDITSLTLDLAKAQGVDATSAADTLGKALQFPAQSQKILKQVGIELTDEQQKQLDTANKLGDSQKAQKILVEALTKSIGGQAEAWGNTLAGKLAKARNGFENIKDSIGASLLPIGTKLLDKFILPLIPGIEKITGFISEFISEIGKGNSPITEFAILLKNIGETFGITGLSVIDISNKIQDIIQKFDAFKNKIVEFLAPIITWIQNSISIKDVLIALGIAVAVVVLPALWGLITAVATILLPIVALIAIIALLRNAWESNFLGIRDIITNFWNNSLKPAFEAIALWLKTNIPIAIQKASDFWNNTLHPALMKIADYWNNTLKPAFEAVKLWLETNIPLAINTIKTKWDELKTKFEEIKTKIDETVTKLKALIDNGIAVVQLAIKDLKDKWEELKTKMNEVKDKVLAPLEKAFNSVKNAIQWVIDKVLTLIEKLGLIKVPKAIQQNSPSPLEQSLYSIRDAMDEINNKTLPKFQSNLGLNQTVFSSSQSKFVQFVYSPTFSLANRYEAEHTLRPIIESVVRRSG